MNHRLQVQEFKTYYQINGCNFSIKFNRILGRMTQWKMRNQPVFTSAPTLRAWRPPTENDMKRDAAQWDDYFLGNLQCRIIYVSLQSPSTESLQTTVEAFIGAVIRDWGFVTTVTYSIYGDGTIALSHYVRPRGFYPKTLPRLGLDMHLPTNFTVVDWFGCGPEQSYADKRNSQKVGLHSRWPDTLYTPYEFPQQNGNRAGTRWLRLTNSCGSGFQVTRIDRSGRRGEDFDFTAPHYTGEDLANARHPTDLRKREEVFLRLDAAHTGLDTARCGPGTLEKYQVPCIETSFAFVFEPTSS